MDRFQDSLPDVTARMKLASAAALSTRRAAPAVRREVGSELEFDEKDLFQPVRCSLDEILRPEGGTVTLLHSGRAAIRSALRAIASAAAGPLRFLLPSYLCAAVLKPFQDLSIGYDFYPVDDHLCADWEYVRRCVESGRYTGVIFLRYFGSTLPDAPPANLSAGRPDFFLIEDLAQAMLSPDAGGRGEYVVYSMRKFFGLPDGGAVVTRKGCPIARAAEATDGFFGFRLVAFRLRELYRTQGLGGKELYREAFREAEEVLNFSAVDASISPFSIRLIERQDMEAAGRRRRENFAYLHEHWPDQKEIVPLPLRWRPSDVPLGFPVVARNRDAVQKALIRRDIFPPIHWPLPEAVRAEDGFQAACELSGHMLTIPCDQRYVAEDMKRVVGAVREIVGRRGR